VFEFDRILARGDFVRIIVSLVALCGVLLNGGCAVWEKETTNRGGYLDYVVDQNWMKADSKRMRALRAFAIQVSLARIASVASKNDSDRQLLGVRIGALTARFKPIYACAFNLNPLRVAGAEKDPCFYYDSAMVEYSTGLFDLAMIALPIEDTRKLVNSVEGAVINPINLGDVLTALVTLGRDALNYGRIVGALYRDTVELEVQLWLATPAIDDRPISARVTEAQVAALREIYNRGNDDMPAWLAAIAALRAQGLEPLPDAKFFVELGGLMKYTCDLITRDPDASKACKAGLPTTLPAPVSVLSPLRTSPAVITGPPNRGTLGGTVIRPPIVPPPPPPPPPPVAQLGTDPDRDILKAFLKVGNSSFDAGRARTLQQLLAVDSIQAELKRIQGAGRAPLLPEIVDFRDYAPVRKLMVEEARRQGLLQ
jgi:hypothetical protein